MIQIEKSATADTRTCDKTKVTDTQLLNSSLQHIGDVAKGLGFFAAKLVEAASAHDYDKLSKIGWFHADFTTDILKKDGWLENHYRIHRHHLDKELGVPADVNLVDVIEHIVDCVMAGMGRSGDVWPINLPNELLQQAVANTVELLKSQIEVVEGDE